MNPEVCPEFKHIFLYFEEKSVRMAVLENEKQLKEFKSESKSKKYVYLIQWSKEAFSWGTMSNSSDRLRKASLFNPKLTGKYDRRVDYLMLKIIEGQPNIFLFEFETNEKTYEEELRQHFNQQHCYFGFPGKDRREISEHIYARFQETDHWQSLSAETQEGFADYMGNVYFNKAAWKPIEGNDRSWAWGDSLGTQLLRKSESFAPRANDRARSQGALFRGSRRRCCLNVLLLDVRAFLFRSVDLLPLDGALF